MFENQQPEQNQPTPTSAPAKDMFTEGGIVEPVVMQPTSQTRRVLDPTPFNNSGLPEPLKELPDDPLENGGNRKFFVLGIVVLVLLVLGGVYFAYAKFFKGKSLNPLKNIEAPAILSPSNLNKQLENQVLNLNFDQAVNTPTATETTENTNNVNANVNAELNNEAPAAPLMTQPEVVVPAVDSDRDGLTDDEEKTLGTDPNNADTDNDGLFDREEVKVYLTDPLNPDTDQDGYLDGEEVKNGYDPKGPGKLLQTNF